MPFANCLIILIIYYSVYLFYFLTLFVKVTKSFPLYYGNINIIFYL